MTRDQAAKEVVFRTITELGSFVLNASVERRINSRIVAEATEIRWEDPDVWLLLRYRDSRLTQKVLVHGGVAWVGTESLEKKEDAEPYRVMLGESWDPWKLTMEPFEEQLVLTEVRKEQLEGRTVRVFQIAVRAEEAPKEEVIKEEAVKEEAVKEEAVKERSVKRHKKGWVVETASGEVWLDEQTSLRLKGDVVVDATQGKQAQNLHLSFSISGIGESARVPNPIETPAATPSNIP
jgi:hypothetical protein